MRPGLTISLGIHSDPRLDAWARETLSVCAAPYSRRMRVGSGNALRSRMKVEIDEPANRGSTPSVAI